MAELIAAHKPGYALEQRFYTDPAIYELELERIVNRNWIMAGHESQFANPGDFRVFKVGRESAIIVRDNAGQLRGFANVCRHRGSLLCLEAHGHTDNFKCPYHGWTYSIDGELIAARNMPEGFDQKAHSLKPVSVDVIHGLVFACFTNEPLSLQECKHEMAEPMDMFGFSTLKVAAQKNYAIAANWKLAIENYQECYHCATAHPEYAQMHTLMLDPEKRKRVQGTMQAKMSACGVKKIFFDHVDIAASTGEMGYGYSRTALFDKYKTGSEGGSPVAPLLGQFADYDGGASDFSFGAFSFLLGYSDHVVAYVFTPVDHNNSNCEIVWMVRSDAVEGKDYDIDKLTWLWNLTLLADKKIVANNSRGVHSKYYEPGPLSGMEKAERNYIEWLLRELQGQS